MGKSGIKEEDCRVKKIIVGEREDERERVVKERDELQEAKYRVRVGRLRYW